MDRAAGRIITKLRLHGYEAYFAGGWVRDFLLHRKPKDIDIATNARPEEVQRIFPRSRAIGAQFGVIQVLMYGNPFEVATFRHDHAYADGRHPTTVTFSSPKEDALRRDFTVNGLFYDPVAKQVIDFVNGEEDIQNKLIRTIGDPSERFSEDKLRILRAIRFSCNLNFNIERETWRSIEVFAKDIVQVSWERIRDEFLKILAGPKPETGLDLLRRSGLLRQILPEIESIYPAVGCSGDRFGQAQKSLALLHQPSPVLAMGTLLHFIETVSEKWEKPSVSEQICRRMKFSNEETKQIVDLASSQASFAEPGAMKKSEWMRMLQKANISDHLKLLRVRLLASGKSAKPYRHWEKRLKEYQNLPEIHALVNGDDLAQIGHSPGPHFKQILRSIEDLQLEGDLKTREDALAYIREHYPAKNPT